MMLIKNGTVVDGTRLPAYRSDIGIRNGRIVAIGNPRENGKRTLDATGHIVAPGFIDVHTRKVSHSLPGSLGA
jgi:N-acyl-D-amino-acid deacylase